MRSVADCNDSVGHVDPDAESNRPVGHVDPDVPLSQVTKASQFRGGMRAGLPIFLGYMPVGMAFGILVAQHGFHWWEALLASAGAIAGSGQFVALSTLIASGGSAVAAIIASSIVNLRYLLFSATTAPHVRKTRPPLLVWLGFSLTDETFAINMAEAKEKKSTPIRMAGVGFISWVGWVLGTLIGDVGAGFVKNADKFGVNFAMPAMYAALFVALANNLKEVICGIGAAGIVIVLYVLDKAGLLVIQSYWFIVIAALLAATIATIVWPHSPQDTDARDQGAEDVDDGLAATAAADEMLVGKRALS